MCEVKPTQKALDMSHSDLSPIVLITGASSGFGRACAIRYAKLGYTLILAARSIEKLTKLKSELGSQCDVHTYFLDVSDSLAIDRFFEEAAEWTSRIDVLVNNAGLALGIEPAYECDLEEWETMIDVNVKGVVRMTRAILPAMVKKNHGHIINIGSVAGNWPYPGGNTYCGTKAFVQQFSRALRCDLLGKAIRVTNIEPGMAETEFSVVRMRGDKSKANKVYESTQPLTADDVAQTVVWVSTLPPHINVNTLELMPTCQAWSPFAVDRSMLESD